MTSLLGRPSTEFLKYFSSVSHHPQTDSGCCISPYVYTAPFLGDPCIFIGRSYTFIFYHMMIPQVMHWLFSIATVFDVYTVCAGCMVVVCGFAIDILWEKIMRLFRQNSMLEYGLCSFAMPWGGGAQYQYHPSSSSPFIPPSYQHFLSFLS